MYLVCTKVRYNTEELPQADFTSLSFSGVIELFTMKS